MATLTADLPIATNLSQRPTPANRPKAVAPGFNLSEEMPNGFGPALDDEEAARYSARFFRAGDALEVNAVIPPARLQVEAEAYRSTGYYGLLPEAIETLGPAITDEEAAGYMAQLLA